MASDINIKKLKKESGSGSRASSDELSRGGQPTVAPMKQRRRRPRSLLFSPLARLFFISNLFGLMVLILGSLAVNVFAQGYLQLKMDSISAQADLVTSMIGDVATGSTQSANLDEKEVKAIISRVELPTGWRLRVYDINKQIVADSSELDNDIEVSALLPLPQVKDSEASQQADNGLQYYIKTAPKFDFSEKLKNLHKNLPWEKRKRNNNRRALDIEIRTALKGEVSKQTAYNEDNVLLASVSVPIKRVRKILGALVLETDDVAQVIAKERAELYPFIGLAVLAALLSSLAMTLFIAMPMRELTQAAYNVTRSSDKKSEIPDLSARKDEIGDLSLVLRDMTDRLYTRVDDIANFAADVAHEIKNPLTSIRSASDTLRVAKTKAQRAKLIDIIQNDVGRMNRLISDISQSSRLDATLAKEQVQILNVNGLLEGLKDLYKPQLIDKGITIEVAVDDMNLANKDQQGYFIRAYETSFAQVLRNLVDNAITFSTKGETISLSVKPIGDDKLWIMVTDQGPGIPEDNLETVFDRFYTQRPDGAKFGSHSGLGLAICRQIVKAHNGRIWVQNLQKKIMIQNADDDSSEQNNLVTNQGAQFIIELPRAKETGLALA